MTRAFLFCMFLLWMLAYVLHRHDADAETYIINGNIFFAAWRLYEKMSEDK